MVHRAEWNPAAQSYRAKRENTFKSFLSDTRKTTVEYSKKFHLFIKKQKPHTSLFRLDLT